MPESGRNILSPFTIALHTSIYQNTARRQFLYLYFPSFLSLSGAIAFLSAAAQIACSLQLFLLLYKLVWGHVVVVVFCTVAVVKVADGTSTKR